MLFSPTDVSFRFGDGGKLRGRKIAHVPVGIDGRQPAHSSALRCLSEPRSAFPFLLPSNFLNFSLFLLPFQPRATLVNSTSARCEFFAALATNGAKHASADARGRKNRW